VPEAGVKYKRQNHRRQVYAESLANSAAMS
jgi:hypothetical protein